jgi:hypothetical protein
MPQVIEAWPQSPSGRLQPTFAQQLSTYTANRDVAIWATVRLREEQALGECWRDFFSLSDILADTPCERSMKRNPTSLTFALPNQEGLRLQVNVADLHTQRFPRTDSSAVQHQDHHPKR